jgi:hypothetical protein
MKKQSRRLLLFALFALLLFGSNILASRPVNLQPQTCQDGCAEKRDKTLENCTKFSGETKTKCENNAQERYNSCVRNCESGDRSGGTKRP